MALLSGWDAICAYTNRGETTLRRWVRENNFPVVKIGGCVESDTDLIDSWRRRRIKTLMDAAGEAGVSVEN